MEPLKIDVKSFRKLKREEFLEILSVRELIITGQWEDPESTKTKFKKGLWYVHTESPGVLIRVDNPEKSICSGWTGAGRPFKNEYMFLSESRLRLAHAEDVEFKAKVDKNTMYPELSAMLYHDLQPMRLGRKNEVAVLDDRNFSHEVLIFNKKYMHLAPAVVKFLNQIK